ncbi:DUF6303 family protein [Streptomyces sp. CA-111067]|uniref:DUF6303 family protein n=1 Tax=Streptomyces sp. CA-111067 TaxID=3240046 RepID=UPI003D95878B
MSTTVRALMSKHPDGRWHLFVPLTGVPLSQHPELAWAAGAPVPTPALRRDALADLGYQAAPGAEWEWFEASPDPDDADTTVVELIASLDVRPAGLDGGAA